MTFGFALLTAGTVLLYSGWSNSSIPDVLSGIAVRKGGAGDTGFVSLLTAPAQGVKEATTPNSGGGNGGDTSARGLATWINPDGSKVLIAKWIYIELKRVGWHGYIESGYRSEQKQREVCATGVQPCADPGTSNHEGKVFPKGAIDVRESEAADLDAKLKAAHSPLVYAGSKDPVHFSHPHGGSY